MRFIHPSSISSYCLEDFPGCGKPESICCDLHQRKNSLTEVPASGLFAHMGPPLRRMALGLPLVPSSLRCSLGTPRTKEIPAQQVSADLHNSTQAKKESLKGSVVFCLFWPYGYQEPRSSILSLHICGLFNEGFAKT